MRLPDVEESRQILIIRNSILRDFEPHLAESTHPDPAQRRANLATRALAGLVVRDRIDCDTAQAAAMVTDGGQDFGIDAVAIGNGFPRVWLIQTKWSDGGNARFGEKDVLAMADGLRRIDHHKYDRFNERLQEQVERLSAVWASPHARITLTMALMRKDNLHDNVIHRLDELCAEFNAHGAYLDYEILDVSDIWDLVRRDVEPPPIHLSVVMDKWFDLSTPMRAVSGTVEVAQVADWHGAHGDLLFRKNIRESLGVTQVNADIERTLLEDPYSFWYRNNGITMLCDSFQLTPISRSSPHGLATIAVTGASIINGAQTVASIAAAMRSNGETAAQGIVGVRIIESSQQDASIEITKSTNTQNHIERRDFVALDPKQISIREDFRLSLGLTYAIRRSEFEPSPDTGCTVREAAVALACAHSIPELAARIRHNEDLLWEEGSGGAYTRLFGVPPAALQIWRSVLLLRAVRNTLNKMATGLRDRAATINEQSIFIVAHLVFQRLGREGIDDEDTEWQPILDQVPDLAAQIVQWLIAETDGTYGKHSFVIGTFTSDDRVRLLVSSVLARLDGESSAPEVPAEYLPIPRRRNTRRPNSVAVIVDAARIKDGTPLTFRPTTEAERLGMEKWLADDPRRGTVTWVNDRSKPLVWSYDGKRYSPSGLVMIMYAQAAWTGAPVAVQGPAKWSVPGEESLFALARSLQEDFVTTENDGSVL